MRYAILCLIVCAGCCLKEMYDYGHAHDEVWEIRGGISVEPLPESVYLAELQVPSLKEQAAALREEYQISALKLQCVLDAIGSLRHHLKRDVIARLEAGVEPVARYNDKLRENYFKIVAVAERIHNEVNSETAVDHSPEINQLIKESDRLIKETRPVFVFK